MKSLPFVRLFHICKATNSEWVAGVPRFRRSKGLSGVDLAVNVRSRRSLVTCEDRGRRREQTKNSFEAPLDEGGNYCKICIRLWNATIGCCGREVRRQCGTSKRGYGDERSRVD